MALRVSSCCGCCSVRTGALIIAILQISFTVFAIIVSAIALGFLNSERSGEEDSWYASTTPATYLTNRVSTSYGPTSEQEALERFTAVMNVMLSVVIVLCLVHLLFNTLLLVGVLQNKAKLVMAWVVYAGICLGVSVASVVFSLFRMPSESVPLTLIQSVISIGLQLYYLTVVRSFHDSLRPSYDHVSMGNAENGRGPSMTVAIQAPAPYPSQGKQAYPYGTDPTLPPPYPGLGKEHQAYPYATDPTLPPPYATAVKQSMS